MYIICKTNKLFAIKIINKNSNYKLQILIFLYNNIIIYFYIIMK